MPSDEAKPVAPAAGHREADPGSARSLLLTVLGEYVLPREAPVWTSVLLTALEGLGVEEKAARQALNRVAAGGWIAAERSGRRVRWALTGEGRTLLAEGARRIYSFGRKRASWDGRWLVLLVSVPETKRELRHRLRTRLTWAGFGSPAPGLWITPDASREAEAKEVVADLGLTAAASSFCGPFAGIGSERTMVEQAWHLGELATRYAEFVREFAGLRPEPGGRRAMLAQIRLVDAWRRFPRLDPQLPLELLPAHWIGVRAANVFTDLHDAWHQDAQEQWDRLLGAE
ncbi:PaaX family transcriptional regulator C-terminal domain-containing protein [Streptomyces sp. VRA16 Mangrove soil]|uniref:PaaX family transcriptional regulator n=1 Tax=Streptomyces sp. VRA16 Mangrove soil TaxID=2817434 RepID=UPI001A9CF58E|nr:PaaX family transcriptional regulator C-terminal domain-containing protein [Streptomyces sp. VRA16 Mangrove soil]MBO1330143.1 PaaX family transcriptional regulator [Streptomyces sp. VRA16 Mangrove soil]